MHIISCANMPAFLLTYYSSLTLTIKDCSQLFSVDRNLSRSLLSLMMLDLSLTGFFPHCAPQRSFSKVDFAEG